MNAFFFALLFQFGLYDGNMYFSCFMLQQNEIKKQKIQSQYFMTFEYF